MSDLPAIFAAIRAAPDHEPHWLALAAYLRDNGQEDEAAAVRVFWPSIRDGLARGRTVENALALIIQKRRRLGRAAGEIEGRAFDGPS